MVKSQSRTGLYNRVLQDETEGRYVQPRGRFSYSQSDNRLSLSELAKGKRPDQVQSELSMRDVCRLIVRGDDEGMYAELQEYCRLWIHYSMIDYDGKCRFPKTTHRILMAMARGRPEDNCAAMLQNEISLETGKRYHYNTVWNYLNVMDGLDITWKVPAWIPTLTNHTLVRLSPTRMISDPSVAAYFANADAESLPFDIPKLELLFEIAVMGELRQMCSGIGAEIHRYRDKAGLQVDAVITFPDGKLGFANISIGPDWTDDCRKRLVKLKARITETDRRRLRFMMVITPTGYASVLPDGVMVIPIGFLKV